MNVLNGIHNFLSFVNDNWVMITTILGLIMLIGEKAQKYFSKSKEEQIAIAKAQISETMLKLVTEAEKNYLTWISAGAVKRSQVIDQIFATYPVLSEIADQQELITWIDEVIDEALKTMRKIFEENKENQTERGDA